MSKSETSLLPREEIWSNVSLVHSFTGYPLDIRISITSASPHEIAVQNASGEQFFYIKLKIDS